MTNGESEQHLGTFIPLLKGTDRKPSTSAMNTDDDANPRPSDVFQRMMCS